MQQFIIVAIGGDAKTRKTCGNGNTSGDAEGLGPPYLHSMSKDKLGAALSEKLNSNFQREGVINFN